ncbi:electron transport complex subunit RsxC [Actinobacillus succinogenes]|uniref:Ion-translocating oxidoreductase complex subunit C n=1 Tax=Actinobacillus succinogenes (strain ATCC 55618 / DSM 22257 / CCUG 43843 / 130Z) TaxID=339671 RepID=RNFC_ACTSZ|nr:electron transport complex subunit RsxC [Actinobacillus succinogenes]A6VQ42.1 RecName: Full=Ion-translocating oxidoreductase complex subunit C; AltName: Full=Rnf electron transport complex subunit C [Actinobacillus succinogenes 130Z]ABR75089.1 electron transport complex, RnfABCDGE type, C subunit [Actinobacillus succinogenes 130Z]PHI40509.1 electron transport complex subunit RsxC [Actinobacillus succinogenes]
MTDVLTRYNSGKLWDFDGGIHPPEMKSQSNSTPISTALLAEDYYVPVKQHAGNAGNLLVKEGDYVLKGQPLTLGDGLRVLPVHAPTSGTVVAIEPHIAAHPSGLSELAVHIHADGKDQWRPQNPTEDYFTHTPERLIEKIYRAGVAGLGGAVFPTGAKVDAALGKVKLLIINGAECEPYITCDDRLMRDYAAEIIEGVRILRYILRPEKVVIAIEDNKPEAVNALRTSLQGANDMDIRVIPTKYPSGAAKQLIYVLTGMEVPHGQRSSSIGVLMQNVGTAFAVKRAVINDEPLIERVVTLTGDKIPHKGNQWVRLGTPIDFILKHVGYQPDNRFPVFVGGPMMGLIVPDLRAPITKTANCLLAPDHFEYDPQATEQACIRCSACSDACPVHLMPQQMYWYARAEDHEKSNQYQLMDCIECGLCAYVCPSHIPLIQYFRQEKAKIWDIEAKARKSEEAKIRFEARQARLEREEQARKARSQRAAAARREELAANKGEDPVQAALARLKAKKAGEAPETGGSAQGAPHIKTIRTEKGQSVPDNSEITALRRARRLARQQTNGNSPVSSASNSDSATISADNTHSTPKTAQNQTAPDPKKAAVAVAIARAKAKKAAQTTTGETVTENVTEKTAQNPTAPDPKKAAVAAAIARAKAKKAAQATTGETATEKTAQNPTAPDPKKAAVAAAIARAKAKKAAMLAESEKK